MTLNEKLARTITHKNLRFSISMPPRHSKLLSDDTPVFTSHGWKAHGDLVVGDRVVGLDGSWVDVIRVFPKDIATHRITFSDGESICCNEDHLWLVYDRSSRKDRVVSTSLLLKRKLKSKIGAKSRCQIQMPFRPVVQGDTQNLPLHPYVLGAWLGDGICSKPCFARHVDDNEVVDEVERLGFKRTAECLINAGMGRQTYFERRLLDLIKSIGVFRNKHVPAVYLRGDVGQRLELLAGLLDTDGSVGKDGRVRFTNTNMNLIESVEFLANSFGWRTSRYSVDPTTSHPGIYGKKICHCVGFNPTFAIPTRIGRKRISGPFSPRRRVGIESIVKLDKPVPGNCIEVSHPNGIYLAGRKFTPTHNSQSSSLWTPAWYLWMRPRHRVILSTYAAEFSASWGRKVRDLIIEHKNFFQLTLSESALASDQWETDQGGGMKTAGRGGAINGFGGDLLIADDLIKNSEEANSLTIRDSAWEWWQSTFMTRLEPGGSVICLATRWHEDDPIGRIKASEEKARREGDEPEGWEFFDFPAIAEGLGTNRDGTPRRDEIGRKDGDALWPERYDEKALARIRRSVGPAVWNALYQQRPVPPDGSFFKRDWLRTYKLEGVTADDPLSGNVVIQTADGNYQSYPVTEMTSFMVADTAMTTKKENDATAIGSFWVTPKRQLILRRLFHGRMTGPDVEKQLLRMYSEDQCGFMAIEDRANGIVALQRFMDIGINAKKLKAATDKVTRATPLQIMMEQGRVFFPEDMPSHQYNEVLKEFLKFPKAAHDDIVDMMAHAANVLTEYTYDTDGEPVVIDMDMSLDPQYMEAL